MNSNIKRKKIKDCQEIILPLEGTMIQLLSILNSDKLLLGVAH